MVLRNTAVHRDKRLLLPAARDMMKACCPRFQRLALERADMLAMSDGSGDEGEPGADEAVNVERLARCVCAMACKT